MRIVCIGISHKTSGVELRERLAFDSAARSRALRQLNRKWADAEFAILSTCNRVEIFTARPVHSHPRAEELRHWLAEFHSVDSGELGKSIYEFTDADAAEHLFEVAAGLDSMVPGEAEIAAQVKDAYAAAGRAGSAGRAINELFQQAMHVVKHVRSETGIGTGKVSVATVAIDCIDKVFDSLTGKCVLSIGAGKMNQLMLKYLGELGAGQIRVANRSAGKAEALAASCGGKAVSFARLAQHLKAADIVITSTASPSPIITTAKLATSSKGSPPRQKLIVDLAVPRDVCPDVGELRGVHLYNIDDLQQIVKANMHRRRGQRKKAMAIIAEHVTETMDRLSVRNVAPTIDALYKKMEAISDEALAAAAKKLANHDDAEIDLKILQAALRRTVRRILHPAAKQLKSEAGSDAARVHVASLRKLFELD